MESNVAQCRYLLSLAERIFTGLDDDHRALEPLPGAKTAGWLIGHLAVTGDFARRLCGRPPLCPTEWRSLFNPGTQPSAQPGDYPRMTELRQTFVRVYADLCVSAPGADRELLARENPYAPARAAFPTSGEFVVYMLSGHLGYHLGQLAAWRAAAGLGRLPGPDTLAV
jgi:DinB family protein